MRACLVAVLFGATAVAASDPQKLLFTRVFPVPGQIGLFIAAADGSDERPLLGSPGADYNPAWSADGAWLAFTSERNGSADLYRVRPNGTDLERLTDSPAFDDQAAFSPDGRQIVFVTSRAAGTADLWLLDVQTRSVKPLTSGAGGDFRPAWSPDGQLIAFSSDRGSGLPFAHGRWEHLHLVDIYLIRPDGSGLKRLTERGGFCGSPTWSADSRRIITYCMSAEETLAFRRPAIEAGNTSLVSIDVATGAARDVPAGPGVKIAPVFLRSSNDLAFIRKDAAAAGIHYSSGRGGPKGDLRSAAWSPDGTRVAFHKRLRAGPGVGQRMWSRLPDYELRLAGVQPSFHPSGDRYAMTDYVPTPGSNSLLVVESGSDTPTVVFHQDGRSVLGPQWSPRGDAIVFGIGRFGAFFNGFHDLFLKPADRVDGGAQIASIAPDGSGFRELTSGPNNNGFPSLAPDGRRFVYRTFGPEGEGLRVMNIDTKAIATLTSGYDNFPLWSPRGDLIMFSRLDHGDYEIYTVKPDGTGIRRLTSSPGNDAHQGWSPDGEQIVFASSRMGFKDEVIYTDAPQPYGEIFVMQSDGSNVRQLTDNQWEDGTPAWQPVRPALVGAVTPSPGLEGRASGRHQPYATKRTARESAPPAALPRRAQCRREHARQWAAESVRTCRAWPGRPSPAPR
jgi:TolB protein